MESIGVFGSLLQLILIVNAFFVIQLLVLAVPCLLILRDVRHTAKRFGLLLDPKELTGQKEKSYLDAAAKVFSDDPGIVGFVYGHTHSPSIRHIGERVVINTGTWIKKFQPTKVRFGILPRIYVPSYRLSSFRIHIVNDEIVVGYREIDKRADQELTGLQRLMVSAAPRPEVEIIPERTLLNSGPLH